MSNFKNAIALLENQKDESTITANAVQDVLCGIIEETEQINGAKVSDAAVVDDVKFASGIAFLSDRLLGTIEGHRNVFDTLPGVSYKRFTQYEQGLQEKKDSLADIREKIDAANAKKQEYEAAKATLDKEVQRLQAVADKQAALEKDIAAFEELRNKLASETEGESEQIMEYQSSLTAIKNAWNTISGSSDLESILSAYDGFRSIDANIKSFQELSSWFEKMGQALQLGINLYSQAYKVLLDTIQPQQQ